MIKEFKMKDLTMATGRYIDSKGCYVDLYDNKRCHRGKNLQLDRIFVPEKLRRQGYAEKLVKRVSRVADKEGCSISICIMPDDPKSPQGQIIGGALQRLFERNGFEMDEIDGNFYPNDRTRPQKKMQKWRNYEN